MAGPRGEAAGIINRVRRTVRVEVMAGRPLARSPPRPPFREGASRSSATALLSRGRQRNSRPHSPTATPRRRRLSRSRSSMDRGGKTSDCLSVRASKSRDRSTHLDERSELPLLRVNAEIRVRENPLFYDAVTMRQEIDSRLASVLARSSHESDEPISDERYYLEASTAIAGGDSVTQEVMSAWKKQHGPDRPARSIACGPRGSASAEANEREGACWTETDGHEKEKGSTKVRRKNAARGVLGTPTYLWLIVLCTINNQVNTRSVRRSVHRPASLDERAEEGQAARERLRAAVTTTRTRYSGFSPFSSFFFFSSFLTLGSRGGTRAREMDVRESVWTERERETKTCRLFIPRSHSRLRCHTSLSDHSRTTTEPATPPMVGNSARLVPGLGRARPCSAASAAPRARTEVLIGSRWPRHGRPDDEAGWGSGAAHGRVPGSRSDVPRRRHRVAWRRRRPRRRDGSSRAVLFPSFLPSSLLFHPSVLFDPRSFALSIARLLASCLARFNRLEIAYPIPLLFLSYFPRRLTTLLSYVLFFFPLFF